MSEIESQFSLIAQKYDSQRRKFIPCFDEFYNCAANFAVQNPPKSALDLGAGTGIMAQKIVEKIPTIKIELWDISSQMLDIAKQRFLNRLNTSIALRDIKTLSGENKYDCIVSALAIHHLEDAEKIDLYKKIYSALSPDGVFVNAEQILGNSQAEIDFYKQSRENIAKKFLEADELKIALDRLKLDRCATLQNQLDWLKKSGFKSTFCPYKYFDLAVIFAQK